MNLILNERMKHQASWCNGLATALMAAGWDGAPKRNAPGFPANGWVVRSENLRVAP